MLGIWSHPDTGTDPPIPAHSQRVDVRQVRMNPIYGGVTSQGYNLRDRETSVVNADFGPSRVPVMLGSIQWNELGSELGRDWGFGPALRGITPAPRAANVPVQIIWEQNRWGNPGEYHVMEPSFLPPAWS